MSVHPDEPSMRLDVRLLQSSCVAAYRSVPLLEEDTRWFREQGYRVVSLDAAVWSSREDSLRAFGVALDFPDYYGINLDALNDCLRDVVISPDSGLVLVLSSFDLFQEKAGADFTWNLLDIIATTSRFFLISGRRLLVLVQVSDPDWRASPVGAQPVLWNPREFFDAKRRE